MKIVINIVLIIVVGVVAAGYYLKTTDYENADGVIGVGILIMAFILMPLFLIHRYKGKDLNKYVDGIDLNQMEEFQKKKKED